MASTLYDKARERFLKGEFNWQADVVKCLLVDSASYVVNLSTHEYLADVSNAARVATSGALTNKTTTGGAADADDLTFTNVTGPSIEVLILYKDTGVEATSPLIAYLDTGTGLPLTPNGGDVIVTWDNGVNRIFRV